jgi:hypothetical protein
VIQLFPGFFTRETFRPFVGSNIGIDRLMSSQAGTMLHELVHLVSQNRMRVVIARSINTWSIGAPLEPAPMAVERDGHGALSWNSGVEDVDPRMWANPHNVCHLGHAPRLRLTVLQADDTTVLNIVTAGSNGPLAYGLSRSLAL